LRLRRRGGFCAAANAGVRAARHPVVELLNDDAEVTAGWAEAALARFADPAVAAVAPLVLRGPPGSGAPHVDSAGDRYFVAGVAPGVGVLRPAGAAPAGAAGPQRGARVLAEPPGRHPGAVPAPAPGGGHGQGLAALAGGPAAPLPGRPAARAGRGRRPAPP